MFKGENQGVGGNQESSRDFIGESCEPLELLITLLFLNEFQFINNLSHLNFPILI